ncbi:MAG: DUF1735 domain-containing protein [Dysgonamonadaceae bacterium]|jgi:hypothetical protein|nr:DUF1735 domain-containing protein [Dysgonamonadaceae bacterium]
MKRKLILSIAVVLSAIGFSSCEKGDGFDEYGFAYIYMPQATVNGGLNNNYYVPSGEGEYTYNFKIEGNQLKILLGVLRSGDLPNKGFSVDVVARRDTTQQIITNNLVDNGVVFPQELYSLPEKVIVPDNKNSESFYMTVPVDALKNDAYTGKRLVLTVAIANPTQFELSEVNTNTVVILDVNAIRTHIQ